jgi:hypothetical protein
MWDQDSLQSEIRRNRRRKDLGDDPRCLLCGFGRTEALTKAKGKLRQAALEEHHVAGKKNDPDFTVILCLNCHRVVTEKCRQAGLSLGYPETVLHRIVALLRGAASLLPQLADRCFSSADKLESLIELLDETYPGWRDLGAERPR